MRDPPPYPGAMLPRPTVGVTHWMRMFRWIAKAIRDDHGIDEARLTRRATLEPNLGLAIEQVEETMEIIAACFTVSFPQGTLNEVLRLEELCMLASRMKGLYRRPPFLSGAFAAEACRMNPQTG